MAEYRFEVPEDMILLRRALEAKTERNVTLVVSEAEWRSYCHLKDGIPATESLQDARNGPKAAMDTDSSNGAPGAPVGASNGRT